MGGGSRWPRRDVFRAKSARGADERAFPPARLAAPASLHAHTVRLLPWCCCVVSRAHNGPRRNQRLLTILDYRWNYGSALPKGVQDNLSSVEQEFARNYDRLLGSYMGSLGVDLTSDLQPPKELFVQVRVLRDCGDIYTDDGTVSLKAQTTHHLRRLDAEPLIRKGLVEHVA